MLRQLQRVLRKFITAPLTRIGLDLRGNDADTCEANRAAATAQMMSFTRERVKLVSSVVRDEVSNQVFDLVGDALDEPAHFVGADRLHHFDEGRRINLECRFHVTILTTGAASSSRRT